MSHLQTPLLTLDRAALAHNEALMIGWARERRLELAPHGKTTMAPQLWQRLLDSGAWGITLATGWQVQVARAFGIRRILLANVLVDRVALEWLGAQLADPDFEFACWVDSLEAVAIMEAGLSASARAVDVVVELGADGGRSGARSLDAALAVAAAVEASPRLRLVGVGGYEGSYARDRSPAALDAVARFVERIRVAHDRIHWAQRPIVTAGGSAFFDLVADGLAPLVDAATVVIRAGAYQVHDAGFYRRTGPLAQLRPAAAGWSRVVSRPEPHLAILDGGKRDFPYDLGLPTTHLGTVFKLDDQHAYLRLESGVGVDVGQVVRLGLSHPCTAFDKWRLIPVLDGAGEDSVIVDLVSTYF